MKLTSMLFPALATTLTFGASAQYMAQSCSVADASPSHVARGGDIVDVAAGAGQFETLLAAVKAAGLVDTLKSDGPLTVFAPTDDAFAKLPEGTIPALLKDKAKLKSILTYHVVAGRVMAKDLIGESWAATVQGQSLRVVAGAEEVRIDGARVVNADIAASNGVIHVIDSVMMPREDIVGVADGAGSFKTLLAAAKAAGLVDTLKSKGPFTVFAPTDAAFDALPEGTIPALLKDKEKLAAILKYHVVSGRVLAEDLPIAKDGKASARPASVQGQKLEITRSKDGNVTVDEASVVMPNVIAGNGVIHVIDKVILPN